MLNGFQKLFSADTILLPIYCYGIIKIFLPAQEDELLKRSIFIPLRIILALIFFLVIFGTLIICALCHEIVHWHLKFKYGKQFCMLLDGSAVVFTGTKRPIVLGVFVYDAIKPPLELYSFMLESLDRMVKTHPVLSSVVCTEMGYHFYKKIDFNIKSIVRPLAGYSSGDEFNQLLDKIGHEPLPFDDSFMWDLQVGQVPIKWPDLNGDKLQIPVLIRYNHMLGDGITILTLCTSYFMKNGLQAVEARCNEYKEVLKKSKFVVKSLWQELADFTNKNFVMRVIFDPEKTHVLHKGFTTFHKKLVYGLDTEDGKYLKKVKTIKNRIPGVSFNDVLYTVISASLDEHLRTLKPKFENDVLPESVLFIMPYFVHSLDYNKLINMEDPQNPKVKMTNKFSVSFVRVPVCDEEVRDDLYKRLIKIQSENELIKDSLDLPFFLWQVKVLFTLAPKPLLKYALELNDGTVVLSNVTGHGGLETKNGFMETDLLIWSTNYRKTGLTMVAFSYNNRLRISMLQDTNFIRTKQQGQQIIDNIFENIDKLDVITSQIKIKALTNSL